MLLSIERVGNEHRSNLLRNLKQSLKRLSILQKFGLARKRGWILGREAVGLKGVRASWLAVILQTISV